MKEEARSEICNPENRGTEAFGRAGCKFSYALYSGSEAGRDDYVVMELVQDAGDCTFETRGDDPHLSSGDVSVHGWWNDLSPGDCPTYADVEVWLQAWACIGMSCWWDTLDTNEERHTEGGGSGNRTNARWGCNGIELISFRNVIDVDLVGVSDPSGYEYVQKDLNCYPQ